MQIEDQTPVGSGQLKKARSIRAIRTKKRQAVELPDNTLTRFMFWELLVRISYYKYRHSGLRFTVSECFVKFVTENYF